MTNSPKLVRFWSVGGSQSTWREPTQTRGEHANSTWIGPGLGIKPKLIASCCKATVLTTAPPGHPEIQYLIENNRTIYQILKLRNF